MGLDKLLKHAVIGAGAIWVASKPLDKYLNNKTTLSAEEKAKYKTLVKGGILGAVTGDYIGEEINNGAKYNINERIQNIALGAAAGAVGSYLILNGKHKQKSAPASGAGDAASGDGDESSDGDGDPASGQDFESS